MNTSALCKTPTQKNQQTTLCYEHPVDEQTRICLRLETLFNHIQHFMQGESYIDSHATLNNMMDILNILDRPDIKTRLLQTFKYHYRYLDTLRDNQEIDVNKLQYTLAELSNLIDQLHNIPGRLGQSLRHHEFLNTLRQHLLSPGGATCFDAAAYFYWQQYSVSKRQQDLQHWLAELHFVQKAVNTLLHLVRHSAQSKNITAPLGFYQQTLKANQQCKLIQVTLCRDLTLYPEISAGRHRLSVHFYTPELDQRPARYQQSVDFVLSCCCL